MTSTSPITALPSGHSFDTKTILSKSGYTCALLTFGSGDDTLQLDAGDDGDHVVFVVEGAVTVRSAGVNTLLNREEALLIPKSAQPELSATPGGRAKVLHVSVPPRLVVSPPLVSVAR